MNWNEAGTALGFAIAVISYIAAIITLIVIVETADDGFARAREQGGKWVLAVFLLLLGTAGVTIAAGLS